MARALFLLLVAPLAAITPAQAQQGAIHVAPVMVAMSAEHNIASLRLRNGRADPAAFEAEVFEWRQEDGRDVLIASRDLLVAPGVFEIAAGGEQVVRLGVLAADAGRERAFRIILRELPRPRAGGAVLGFALEMSLPVFIAPAQARGALEARAERRPWGPVLLLANTGQTHIQIAALADLDHGAIDAPRYLLAGASVEIPLSPQARAVRVRAADIGGVETERVVHVRGSDHLLHSGR